MSFLRATWRTTFSKCELMIMISYLSDERQIFGPYNALFTTVTFVLKYMSKPAEPISIYAF